MTQKLFIFCSGIHDVQLTENFIAIFKQYHSVEHYLVFPTNKYLAYSPWHLYHFLQQEIPNLQQYRLIFIAFSAGCVAAIGTATILDNIYHNVNGLIAFDGWGVPLVANFPIYRVSHDYFTHWSSQLLGGGTVNFYANPDVSHLDLWGQPQQVRGWQVESLTLGNYIIIPIHLLDFLISLLERMQQD
jgi:hypothetical protein